jgi:hypothetical protein
MSRALWRHDLTGLLARRLHLDVSQRFRRDLPAQMPHSKISVSSAFAHDIDEIDDLRWAMRTPAGRLLVLLLAVVIPAEVTAQTPTSSASSGAPRDRLAVGVALTPVPIGALEFYPTARLTVPLGSRIGLDVDVGRTFPATRAYYASQAFVGAGVRFMRSHRAAGGSSRYWSLGPACLLGKSLDGHGQVTDQHSVISAFKLGYGADQIFGNGIRAAAEIGVIGGGGRAPTGVYATLVVQWQPRR